MSRQVRVNSADLVAHAGQVDGIGDGLTIAQQAGAAVRTDSGAYGQLCQFVPALPTLRLRPADGGGRPIGDLLFDAVAGEAHGTAAGVDRRLFSQVVAAILRGYARAGEAPTTAHAHYY